MTLEILRSMMSVIFTFFVVFHFVLEIYFIILFCCVQAFKSRICTFEYPILLSKL